MMKKKINYDLFKKTINKLSDLEKQLIDKKEELKSNNDTLTDKCNWKGASRDYYNQIAAEQEKAFEKIGNCIGKIFRS